MKRFIIMAIGALLFVTLFSFNAAAEKKAVIYLGEKVNCVEVSRIKETRVLDNQTILFEIRGGAFYLNRLPVTCSGLKISGGFSYSTFVDKLCKQDSIKIVEPGSAAGSTCPLGEFIQFNQKGTLSEVEKLLDNGLLKELVAEGVFKDAFPQKK
jgi:hypothetical protein